MKKEDVARWHDGRLAYGSRSCWIPGSWMCRCRTTQLLSPYSPGIPYSLNLSLRHEVARLIVWHVVTRPVVPSAVSYADVRLRRESSMEECRKTSGIQVPDEPLE